MKKSFDAYKKISTENGKAHLRQRAKEAVEIVQTHHPQLFVQQYTKQKVYSEMFFNLRGPLPQEEQMEFQRQR